MSNTCVGCRYNKDMGTTELKNPVQGHWERTPERGPGNELGLLGPKEKFVQTGGGEVHSLCQTFTCQCPHPATCYDGENDTLRIYTRLGTGEVETFVAENGCEHYTPTDEVLWEGNTIQGWLQQKIIKLGADEAIEEIAKKIQSLIVEE